MTGPIRRKGLIIVVTGLLLVLGLSFGARAQGSGERVYAGAADATFLLEISDSSGTVIGNATGFLVAANQILTNAHVADAGTISVRMGTLQIGCEVKRVDPVNDLAICEMAAKSSATPIKFAEADPKPGATVFALGNPRGLERTISQGLFTGFRDLDGHRVAQISAAISPGSSGGPILNMEGEAVGVAVSSLTNGQTLNFAVPLGVVRDFLSGKGTATDAESLINVAKGLKSQRDELKYDDPRWKELDEQLAAALTRAVDGTSDVATLTKASEAAGYSHFDIQAAAARKSIQLTKVPTREMFHSLAEALYYSTDDNGPSSILREAEQAAERAVALGRGLIAEDLSLLAGIQSQSGNNQAALAAYLKASMVAKPGTDQLASIYLNLFRTSDALGKAVEAEGWFKKAESATALEGFALKEYATFLEKHSRESEAGAVLMEAFRKAPAAYSYVCQASFDYFVAADYDEALPAARQCLALAAPKNATSDLIWAHKIISAVLRERGVYDESANHAREAIVLDPEDAYSHHLYAKALSGQRRFSEAVSSAKTAIRLSDGKYGDMHFTLGSAYFDLGQWPEAVQSFEKAAQLNPTDSAAAYNVAVSYYNQKYYSDALKWYREALRRNPNSSDKSEIMTMIERLSNR